MDIGTVANIVTVVTGIIALAGAIFAVFQFFRNRDKRKPPKNGDGDGGVPQEVIVIVVVVAAGVSIASHYTRDFATLINELYIAFVLLLALSATAGLVRLTMRYTRRLPVRAALLALLTIAFMLGVGFGTPRLAGVLRPVSNPTPTPTITPSPTATPAGPLPPRTSAPIALACLNCLEYGHPADVKVGVSAITIKSPEVVELTYTIANTTSNALNLSTGSYLHYANGSEDRSFQGFGDCSVAAHGQTTLTVEYGHTATARGSQYYLELHVRSAGNWTYDFAWVNITF